MIDELIYWLNSNYIQFKLEDDIVEIKGFGKVYIHDLEKEVSLFKKSKDKTDLVFNISEDPQELIEDGVQYACFKFGYNWYYTDLTQEFKLNIMKYIGERVPYKHNFEYVNLGVHTPYELLNSSFMPEEWIKKAKFLGHNAIGICDYNTAAGTYPLQKACKDFTGVFGYSLTIDADGVDVGAKVYVGGQEGLRNLLRIQKSIMVDSDSQKISIEELNKLSNDLSLVFEMMSFSVLEKNPWIVNSIMESFDFVYFQVDSTEFKANSVDVERLNSLKAYIRNCYMNDDAPWYIPPVLISDSHYLDKDDAKNKIILNKVAFGAAHSQSSDQYFKSVDDQYESLYPLFEDLIASTFKFDEFFEYICLNTVEIAERANAKYDTHALYAPEYDMKPDEVEKYGTRLNMFNELLEEGFNIKVPAGMEDKYREQLEKEKYVIRSTNNVDYFLILWDMINWANSEGILTAYARGSAGGALISYLLGIIKIDPLKYDLMFERFLVPERGGLIQTDVTVLSGNSKKSDVIVIETEDGKNIPLSERNSEVLVNRGGDQLKIMASEIQEGDDLILDRNDELWNI